ncbi:MAG TPA: menaquinone biosynthesis protein [Candidatus Thermoplasmatota archaeon]|nr:menaquinone biosynthesis protein [Candidatus Thermoplasmatota archaeon]
MRPVRLGAIDFYNSLPVYQGLYEGAVSAPHVDLVKGTPTELNRAISRGDLDITPMSSIEYALQAEDLVLLPDLSINSVGFVDSVVLFGTPTGRVCLTRKSATSVVLLKILLKHWGSQAELFRGTPRVEEVGKNYDGALLIGDECLEAALTHPGVPYRDLGEEWLRLTRSPMVFAVWAARRDFAERHPEEVERVHQILLKSRAWGLAHLPRIVEVATKASGFPAGFMARYYEKLKFEFGPAEQRGLARFYEEAHRLGELSRVPPLPLPKVPA